MEFVVSLKTTELAANAATAGKVNQQVGLSWTTDICQRAS